MEDLILDGGHMPDAADYEDLGSEIYSMVQRYESMRPAGDLREDTQAEQQSKQPPKQVIWMLYGVFGMAAGILTWLWSKMF